MTELDNEVIGIVVKRRGERAEVKVDKTRTTRLQTPKYLDCWNPIGAQPGQTVGIDYQEMDDRKAKAIYYSLPVCGILAGVAFGNSLATFFHEEPLPFIAVGVVLWLFVAVSYARIFKRDVMKRGVQPVVNAIEVQELVIDTGKN